jgi:hypothetical protein
LIIEETFGLARAKTLRPCKEGKGFDERCPGTRGAGLRKADVLSVQQMQIG